MLIIRTFFPLGCVEVAVLAWIYGIERFIGDINTMLRFSTSFYRYDENA